MNRFIRILSASAGALPGLVFASAMLLNMSAARSADFYTASHPGTHALCVFFNEPSPAFKLPDLGGSYFFTDGGFSSPTGDFIEGQVVGKARLLGTITDRASKFAVDLVVEGRLNNDPDPTNLDDPYDDTCRAFFLRTSSPVCAVTVDEWHVYTALSGTLTGLTGAIDGVDVAGAVYNVSLGTPPLAPIDPFFFDTATQCDGGDPANPVFQVGFGASTRNPGLGAFAPLNLVLADPGTFPGLPAVTDGKVSISISTHVFFPPTPSPNLTGTWQGSIDCAGIADFTDVESFSDTLVLKVGAQSGISYGAEVSDGAGNVLQTYCGEYANDLTANSTQGTGRMVGGDPAAAQSSVYLKVRKDPSDPLIAATLKARQLIVLPDGSDARDDPDGVSLCKWNFTRTDTAEPDPPIAAGCTTFVCGNSIIEPGEQCDDGNADDNFCLSTCQRSF